MLLACSFCSHLLEAIVYAKKKTKIGHVPEIERTTRRNNNKNRKHKKNVKLHQKQ